MSYDCFLQGQNIKDIRVHVDIGASGGSDIGGGACAGGYVSCSGCGGLESSSSKFAFKRKFS